jgi:hypothetical protein
MMKVRVGHCEDEDDRVWRMIEDDCVEEDESCVEEELCLEEEDRVCKKVSEFGADFKQGPRSLKSSPVSVDRP